MKVKVYLFGMTRQLRNCIQYRKELENSFKIYGMMHQQVNLWFLHNILKFFILNELNSFNISFQVQLRQEKNFSIHGTLLQLRHMNESFKDSEKQEIILLKLILTMK